MLAHNRHAFLALHFLLPAALFAGCVVTTTSDPDPDDEQTGGSGTTTSSTTTSASGGEGGSGGQGGEGGSGGQGGSCVDDLGSGQTAAACDELNISPTQGATRQCGPMRDEDPRGYTFCKRAFTIFAAGHAEDLTACLSTIGVQEACDDAPVQSCVEKMYSNACVHQSIAETCNQIATACGANDPLDIQKCTANLNPFNDAGVQQLVGCMNEQPANASCQTAYDTCVVDVVNGAP